MGTKYMNTLITMPMKRSGLANQQSSSSSSSSYRAGSTDIPDPLSPLLPIVHRPR